MGSYNYTISIGHLGEQLTLNQWVLGSSPRWGNVKGTVEYRSPVCRARICRKSPLIFQHPSFILARRNNRHHFRVSSRMMPMPPGYTKVFGFVPTWCTTKALQKTARLFFATFKEGRRFCAFFWEYAI